MAGYWPNSGQQIFDATTGLPVVGAVANFFEAGTTTPLDVYKDYALGTQHPANIEADSNGRWPLVFLDDGFYKVRLREPSGTLLWQADGIPVIGPTEGGSTGTTVDPDALADTGDLKHHYGTGTVSGWIRCNGRTIGSASSGASERANADTEALFLHLWAADDKLTVSGGRGGSAAADWAADKTIALPDTRGRSLVALDGMGNTNATRLTATYVGAGDPDEVGSSGGAEAVTLTTDQIPVHSHPDDFAISAAGEHSHTVSRQLGGAAATGAISRWYPSTNSGLSDDVTSSTESDHTHTLTGDVGDTGGGLAHSNRSPFLTCSIYIKL